ncbi:MAG TPA: glycosyltransferase family 2 protein [Thermoanaerobaculia bacterium]|nr:glycosyltransferase family 2 protein [Thermoanaerobaculia bacterium]
MRSNPRISIVIPSLNQGRFIEETILSILGQAWPDIELIVIDGGSIDETLDVIRDYEASIDFWISEPDRGQADAINKGLRKATGEIVTWFGADDVYANGIFASVAEAWRRNPDAIYAAPVANFYARGREQLVRPFGLSVENVVQYWKRQSRWHDPGLFWSRAAINAVGEIDVSLRYALDYDYLIRALQHASVAYIDQVAAGFRLHGRSKTIAQTEAMMAETASVSRRYWGLVENLDRTGFERSEYEVRLRRAASKLVRLNREGLPLLRACLREHLFATPVRLAWVFPTVLAERLGRLRRGRHI